MNFIDLFDELEKFDPEVYERFDTRRKAMKAFVNTGKKVAMAAVPTALASMFTQAYGANCSTIIDTLQFALKAEYLEATLYTTGVANASALGMSADLKAGLQKIAYDELLHIELLKSTIQALGGTPLKPKMEGQMAGDYGIDITGGGGSMMGPFKDALTMLPVYLGAAQVFSDTGVRAYKGQAACLISNNAVLQAGLNIHSVEARHVSWVRLQRRLLGQNTDVKPWVTNAEPYLPAPYNDAVKPHYQGDPADTANFPAEDNIMQAGLNVQSLGQFADGRIATESFDEPLSRDRVVMLLTQNAKFLY